MAEKEFPKEVRLYVIIKGDGDPLMDLSSQRDIIFTDEKNKVLSVKYLSSSVDGWEYLIQGLSYEDVLQRSGKIESFNPALIRNGFYVGVFLHLDYPHTQVPGTVRHGTLEHVEIKTYKEFADLVNDVYEIRRNAREDERKLVRSFTEGMSRLGGVSLESLLSINLKE